MTQDQKKEIRKFHVCNEEYLDAIKESKGSLSVIAEQVQQTLYTVRLRIREDPELAAAYGEEYEAVESLAEDRLFEAINAGEPWAIKLFLTTKGAAKGYGLKQTLELGTGPVVIMNWGESNPELKGESQDAPALTTATDDSD